LLQIASMIEPLGTIWVNALRMTVIPMVVSLLIVGLASVADFRSVGRLGGRALLLMLAILLGAGIFSAAVSRPVLSRLKIDPAAAADLRARAAEGADQTRQSIRELPTAAQRITELVPVNPIRAAADGAMLPLIVFTLAFAAALGRVREEFRVESVKFFQAVADAMIVIVGWIFRVAPIGVFALALTLAVRLGFGASRAIAVFVVLFSALLFAVTLALYPLAAALGRVSIRRFALAAAPAQAVGFSSRSSFAALPAMITGATEILRVPPAVTGFVLPFAVAVFRLSTPIGWMVSPLFLARLYGVEIDNAQLFSLLVTSILLSYSVPGIPSGSLFLLAPVLVSVGLPAEGVGILIAVDAIPDLFKTTVNVTGHMTVVTALGNQSVERSP
jgi:Na+/H+-dicarboxylate symporter